MSIEDFSTRMMSIFYEPPEQFLNTFTNETIARGLVFSLSIETFSIHNEVEPERISDILFTEWLRRLKRIPYCSELNHFVYEYLPEYELNDIFEWIGEETLELLFVISTKEIKDETMKEIAYNYMKEKISVIIYHLKGDEGITALDEIIELMNSKYGEELTVLKSILAHLINKGINNSFFSL